MNFVPFNSRDFRHKSIFGSLAAGESLRFSVLMPRSLHCSKVTLVIHDDFNNYLQLNGSNVTLEDILEELVKMYRLCIKYPKYKLNILEFIKVILDKENNMVLNIISYDNYIHYDLIL